MKKIILFSLIATLTVGYFACRKDDSHEVPKTRDPFLDEAIAFLDKQISSSDLASLDVDGSTIINDDKGAPMAVSIPVKNNVQRIVMVGKTKDGLIGNWVDLSKLNAGEQAMHGEMITESFDGKAEGVVSIVNNSVVKTVQTINGKKQVMTISYENGRQVIKRQGMQAVAKYEGEDNINWLPEVTIIGYRINDNTTWYSLYWALNQNTNYLYSFTSTNPYNGGGSGGPVVNISPAQFNGGPGIDVPRFMQCFSTVPDAGATFTITLHTDLPVNTNSDALLGPGASPGHAFLTFTKSNSTTSVSQVIGFYPVNGVKSIFDAPVTSVTQNDGQHEYNASITINVSYAGFNSAKNMAISYSQNRGYDLNDFNCSNYAINVFNMAVEPDMKVTVPDTNSGGLNYGTTPNGLYKKLLQMKNAGASNVAVGTWNAGASKGPCN